MNEGIDFLVGSKLALENAKRLIACADTVSSTSDYGLANSLMILAIEECVKAGFLFCLILAEDKIGEPDKMLSLLRDHRNKHYFGFVTQVILDTTNALIRNEDLQRSAEEYFEGIDTLDTNAALARVEQFISDLMSRVMTKAQLSLSGHDQIGNRDWWRAANMQRNRGFYTDFDNNNWITPKSLLKENFEETREMAVKLLSELEEYKIKSPESLMFLRKLISKVTTSDGNDAFILPDKL